MNETRASHLTELYDWERHSFSIIKGKHIENALNKAYLYQIIRCVVR